MWRAVAEPDAVNLVLVAGAERALLVDTGSSPEQGRAVRAAVAEVTAVPLEVVVVTHAHDDHARAAPRSPTWSPSAHEDVPGAEPVHGARRGVRPGRAPGGGDAPRPRAHQRRPGRGVPDADLVVVGDLVESAAPPSLGPDSFLQEWPITVDGVIGLMTGETRAVPGHGDPVDRPYVYEQRGRLASIAGEVRRLAESGVGRGRRRGAGRLGVPGRDPRPRPRGRVRPARPDHAAPFAAAGLTSPRRTS